MKLTLFHIFILTCLTALADIESPLFSINCDMSVKGRKIISIAQENKDEKMGCLVRLTVCEKGREVVRKSFAYKRVSAAELHGNLLLKLGAEDRKIDEITMVNFLGESFKVRGFTEESSTVYTAKGNVYMMSIIDGKNDVKIMYEATLLTMKDFRKLLEEHNRKHLEYNFKFDDTDAFLFEGL